MTDVATYFTILALYFIVGTFVAWYSRRRGIKTTSDYFVAGYRLGGFLSAMTYAATTYSAFMMIGLVGLAYATGVGAFGFELLYLLATISLLALFSKRVWNIARERKWISPAEMLGDLYGSKLLSIIVAIVYLFALLPYITAQLVGLGNLVQGIGLEYWVGIVLGALVIFLWTYLAGIWSVASTDAYQGLWMILSAIVFLLWLLFLLLPSKGLNLGSATKLLGEQGLLGITGFWTPTVFLAFTLPWLFFAVTNPQVVQRLYMPRDERALKSMVRYFIVFGLAYTVIVTLVGLFTRALTIYGVFPNLVKTRDLVTPTLLQLMHPLFGAIVFTSVVAAAVSTADSIILTLSSTAARDLYSKLATNPKPRAELMIGYITVVLLTLLVSFIAWLRPGFVVELSVLSSVILLPLAPITITAWIKPENVKGKAPYATTALLVGVGIGVYAALIYGAKKAFITAWLGLPISAWILIISTIIMLASMLKR